MKKSLILMLVLSMLGGVLAASNFNISSSVGNLFFVNGTSGNVGIGTATPSEVLDVNGTLQLGEGKIRFNDTTKKYNYYNGSIWQELGTGSGGGGYWSQNGTEIYYNSGNVRVGDNGLVINSSAIVSSGDLQIGKSGALLTLPSSQGTDGQILTTDGSGNLSWSDSLVSYTTYSLNYGGWSNTGSTLPGNLVGSQTAVIGDYVYLFGGFNGVSYVNIIYRAPVSNPTAWTNTGSTLPSTLGYSQVAVIGDYVYLFGGSTGTIVNTVYRAPVSDPTNWSNTGSTLPGILASSQVAVIGDYVYLFGGYNGAAYLNVIYRAPVSDPTNWSNTGSTLPSNLGLSQVAVIGDYVYLFGGNTEAAFTSAIYRAPVSNPTAWTNTGSTLPSNLAASQTAIIGDYIYLFGGSISSATSIIYRAPVSDPTDWSNTGSTLSGNLMYSQTAVIGDYVYLFGGYNGAASINIIYRAPITSVVGSSTTITDHGEMEISKSWKYLANERTLGLNKYFVQNGSSFGELATIGTDDAYDFVLETSDTERMRIDTSGNVGIGTASPGEKLDVNGTLQLGEGKIRFNDTTKKYNYYNGSIWQELGTGSGGGGYWSQNGTEIYYNSGNVRVGDNGLVINSSAIVSSGALQIGKSGALLTLPTSQGTDGQILTTDGSGNLSWSDSPVSYTTYSLDYGSWSNTGSTLPANLANSQTAVIGDYVYLFGGYNGASYTNVIYRAPTSDPTDWSNTGSTLPSNLGLSQVAVIGDYVYLFGGYNGASYTNVIYRAPTSDPTNWSNTGSTLPSNLGLSQVAVIGDYVYLFGGYNGASYLNVIYRAPTSDPTNWTNTGSTLPSNLGLSQVAVIGDYVYLFGGYNGASYTNVIYRAPTSDPTDWSNTGSTLPGILTNSQTAVIGDYVYLFGGYNGASYTNVIYRAPIASIVGSSTTITDYGEMVISKSWKYLQNERTLGLNKYFVQNGSSFGELATIGTNDAYDFVLETSDTERMRIDTSGNVGIGTATPSGELDVNGSVYATAYYYSSDRNLKKDIARLNSSLDKVKVLEGVSFKWKATNRSDIGFIAQDVEKVLPELVSTNNETGLKSVEYGNVVAVLAEAIKEQQAIIESQASQIEELRRELEGLKNFVK